MNSVWISGKALEDVWIRKNDKNRLIASFVIEDGSNHIRCIAFDSLADKAGLWVRKGKWIEVSGALSLYRTQDGRYVFNVQVDGLDKMELGDTNE